MATNSLVHKITANAHVDDKVGSIWDLLVNEQVKIIIYEGKPVTACEVAAKLGERYTEQASAILDELTTERSLAKFRAGFNDYYASPKVALTEKEPNLKTVISDSLKSLLLTLRYKSMRKPKGRNKCSPTK